MDSNGFFVTLLSNSSLSMYPENTTSSFTVNLPQKIRLVGNWKVAVAEIHYNYNFFNVSEGNDKIWFTKKQEIVNEHVQTVHIPDFDEDNDETNIIEEEEETTTAPTTTITDLTRIKHFLQIPTGFYNNMNDLIDTINCEIKNQFKINQQIFSLNKMNNRCEINFGTYQDKYDSVICDGRLNLQLGFEPETNLLEYSTSQHCCNIHFGIPDQMMIYTDIIEPSFIGHEKAYVIKIVNTQPKNLSFGDACFANFEQMHYVNVEKREFESISVNIRHSTGEFMPFQHGVFTLKLHFKRHHG